MDSVIFRMIENIKSENLARNNVINSPNNKTIVKPPLNSSTVANVVDMSAGNAYSAEAIEDLELGEIRNIIKNRNKLFSQSLNFSEYKFYEQDDLSKLTQ